MELNRFVEIGNELRLISLIVSQHGEVIARHDWNDTCRRNIYSATKSFTSAAVGIA